MNLVVLRPGSVQRFEEEGVREIGGFERTACHINFFSGLYAIRRCDANRIGESKNIES
jgi:hypothetical protein